MVRESNPCTSPDWSSGPPCFLYNGYPVFPGNGGGEEGVGVKRPGRGFDHLTPSRAETTELSIYSSSGPWWPVLWWALPLPLPFSRFTPIDLNGRMAHEGQTRRNLEGSDHCLTEVLSWNFLGGSEGNHKTLKSECIVSILADTQNSHTWSTIQKCSHLNYYVLQARINSSIR